MAHDDALLTNQSRHHRGMVASDLCPIFVFTPKSIMHRVRDYSIATQVWNLLTDYQIHEKIFQLGLGDWILLNAGTKLTINNVKWCLLFGVKVSCLWRNKNEFIFSNLMNPANIIFSKIINEVLAIIDHASNSGNVLHPFF